MNKLNQPDKENKGMSSLGDSYVNSAQTAYTINLRYYDNDYHYSNSPMVSQLAQSPLKIANPEQLERIRHTCAHVMAMAVQILFPETKVTIGPTTDTGFYYDWANKYVMPN